MLEYLYGKRFDSKIAYAYWLRLFSSQTISRINTPFSNLLIFHTYPLMKMKQSECSETSVYKIQKMGNYPEESIQHSEQGGSFKSRIIHLLKPKCSLSSPSSSFPSNRIFSFLSPFILDTNPTHSNLSTFYHSYSAWRFKFISHLFIHFSSPVSIFTCSHFRLCNVLRN